MAGESVAGSREPLDQARSLPKSATQRTRVAADPKPKRATRLRAARAAKAALTRVLAQALDYEGTDQERDWWTLHRAAEELFGTADRQGNKLATALSTSPKRSARGPTTGVSSTKSVKLPRIGTKQEARRQRQQLKRKRDASVRPIRVVSGGLGSLGKR